MLFGSIVLVPAGVFLFFLFYFILYHETESYRKSLSFLGPTFEKQKRHIILYWDKKWRKPVKVAGLMKECQQCKNWNCELTNDKRLFRNSSAVIFIAPDFNRRNVPARYKNSQIYVYESREPPFILGRMEKWKEMVKTLNQLKNSNDVFNWTMTYHGNSDINHQFGRIVFLNDSIRLRPEYKRLRYPWVLCESELNGNWNLQPIIKLNHAELLKKIQKKTKMAAWAVGNCKTPSKREQYIKKLAKYIGVDTYGYRGKCHDKHCNPKCSQMWDNDYFFYLSFENSFSRDYVSEKMYKILYLDTIPVVRGGANYTALLPPKSYIDAQDFKGPKELAEFLKNLAANATEYASYFEWKKDFALITESENLCHLCAKLNLPIQYKTHHDIYKFIAE